VIGAIMTVRVFEVLQNGKIHEIYVDNRDTAVKIREMLVVPSV